MSPDLPITVWTDWTTRKIQGGVTLPLSVQETGAVVTPRRIDARLPDIEPHPLELRVGPHRRCSGQDLRSVLARDPSRATEHRTSQRAERAGWPASSIRGFLAPARLFAVRITCPNKTLLDETPLKRNGIRWALHPYGPLDVPGDSLALRARSAAEWRTLTAAPARCSIWSRCADGAGLAAYTR